MAKTSIEWTDASWNPIVGCTEVSPGCANCYAARLAATRLKTTPAYAGLADTHCVDISEPYKARWAGEVRFLPERLEEPLHWREPRRIFVCDMGDLFHEDVRDAWLDKIFNVMLHCPQHTFQVLTKRPARMRRWINTFTSGNWPNVWLGVSVENQHFAVERIPLLLDTPAAVRWISAEPLLGPLDVELAQCSCPMRIPFGGKTRHLLSCKADCRRPDDQTRWAIDWVVAGGESGSDARPMHPDWARSLRDQCQAAGVPFFFKQWGAWWPGDQDDFPGEATNDHAQQIAAMIAAPPKGYVSVLRAVNPRLVTFKVGKKAAGRLLDGREWNQFPGAPVSTGDFPKGGER